MIIGHSLQWQFIQKNPSQVHSLPMINKFSCLLYFTFPNFDVQMEKKGKEEIMLLHKPPLLLKKFSLHL